MSLLQMSFSGAILILAIVVIRALAINRLPKKTFLALWGVALLRLLIPLSLPSMFSVYSVIGHRTSAMQAVQQTPVANFIPVTPTQAMTMLSSTAGINETGSSTPIWTVIWAVGALICFLFFAISYIRCRREFQTSLPVENDFVKSWLITHKIKRQIAIRQSSRICAPLTYGFLRPVILMPKGTDWNDTKSLPYVLAHEYVHIRRFDAFTKLVLVVALCIHWFNPLVWAMYILANRDIELSCDEVVVRLFGTGNKSIYARMLISMEETKSGLTPLCNSFSKNAIEERVTAIMKIKKTSFIATCVAVVLVAGVMVAFATSAAAGNNRLSPVPNTGFTNEEYNKLFALQLDGYEDMTVSEFRTQIFELIDTVEYRELLERFSQDQTLYDMKDNNETVGQMIARAREEKNLSKRELARIAKISDTELARIESGEREIPNPKTLRKISTHIGINYNDLMYAAGLGFQVTSLNPFLINYYEHLKGDQIVDAILNTSSMIKNWEELVANFKERLEKEKLTDSEREVISQTIEDTEYQIETAKEIVNVLNSARRKEAVENDKKKQKD